MALIGWGDLTGAGSRTAKPNSHYGNDDSKNMYSPGIVGKGSNEKYFTLVNKDTGMVEVYNQNWDRPDKLVAQYDPVTKEIKTNPTSPKWERAAFGNIDNPAVKNSLKAAKNMIQREVYNDGTNLNPSVSEKDRKALADKIANDLLKDGSTNVDPSDDASTLAGLADRVAAENKRELMATKGRSRFPDLRYPEKMSEDQDAIKFKILDYKPREWDKDQPGVLKERSRKDASLDKINMGSIILPMPGGLKDNNAQDWGSADLNPLQAVGAQLAMAAFKGGNEVGSLLQNVANDVGSSDMEATAQQLIAGQIVGDTGQLIKRQGALINPNVELLFNNPLLREFNFSFNLSPRNPNEAQTIKQIIRTFKQSSAPRRTIKGYFLRTPLIYQISYINNAYNLNRFKECALTSFQTDYTPNGNYSTFRDGTMTQYKISMTFKELDPVFNDDYDALDEANLSDPEIFSGGQGPLAAPKGGTDSAGIGY